MASGYGMSSLDDRQQRADEILRCIGQSGYRILTVRAEHRVICTGTSRLGRRGVGTSDQGDALMAAIALAGMLRISLPLHLQPQIGRMAAGVVSHTG